MCDDTMTCPGPNELAKFAVGDMPVDAFDRIANHVASCRDCEAAIDRLGPIDDPLLTHLHGLDEVAATAGHVPERLLQTARGVRHAVEPSPRRQLGKFELLEELGVGSFGRVYRARDSQLGRTVAIKLLRAGEFASRDEVDRFLREARSAAQLQHQGIVAVYDTGQTEDGSCYIVEEFVEGQTLAAMMGRQRFDFRTSAALIAEVATALEFAHRRGVVHRDMKPSNLMLDAAGRPHVMDFGLAKLDTDDAPMTEEGQVLGTPAYMSPEQARGEIGQIDARTDIYGLGVMLYELLTGERPFRGNRRMLLLQVLQDEPRPPRTLNDKIPGDLETICLKAMAKLPSRRYRTAGEMADDLHRWLQGEPIQARPVSRTERLWRWCRRNPLAVGLLLAVTLGSALGLWHLVRLSDQLVEQSALESAAQQAEMLEEVNEFYTVRVVDRLTGTGVNVTHDYAAKGKGKAVPLPATLTIELGREISSKSKTGMAVRLYSDYPFRTRKGDAGPQDDFEREAMKRLYDDPTKPYWSFETYQGKPALRYATAQKLKKTCVECHNHHNDSVKRDWKEGEVGGALEIIRPLDADVERARQGLRGTFISMALTSGSLLAASLGFVLISNRRRRALPRSEIRA
jgi:serine/threonine protein kinase